MDEKRPYLLYAYGNPGRLDDGLGPACAKAFEALALPQLTVESDYQLTVEEVEARASSHFTSHICDAATVLATAREALEATPHAFLLAIRGYEFHAYGEQLSEGALRNLSKANEFLREVFEGGGVEKLLLAASLNRASQGSERGGEVKP